MIQILRSFLQSSFELPGDVGDLDRTSEKHSDKRLALKDLGNSYQLRFERLGDMADLEMAISYKQTAVDLTPDNDLDKPSLLNDLGHSMHLRFQRLGNVSDLERTILLIQDAVDLTPGDHPDKPSRLKNLGNSWYSRYMRFNNVMDLEQAIKFMQDAVNLTSDGHPNKPEQLSSLGNFKYTRYKWLEGLIDLYHAILLMQVAVDLTPDGHPDKPSMLYNLGNAIQSRYARLGDVIDLEQAISLLQVAVDLTPDGHPDKPEQLGSLGNFKFIRYKRFGDLTDLDHGISLLQVAVNLTPDGHLDKIDLLNNLGDCMQSRSERLWGFSIPAAARPFTDGDPVTTSLGAYSETLQELEPYYSFKLSQANEDTTSPVSIPSIPHHPLSPIEVIRADFIPSNTGNTARECSPSSSTMFVDNGLHVGQAPSLSPKSHSQAIGDIPSSITPSKVNGLREDSTDPFKTATDLTSLLTVTSKVMGQGGYACVYLGILRGKKMAVKALRIVADDSDKWERRLRREIAVLSSLNHPNITPFYGVVTTSFSPLPAIVTPWYNNGSADKYLPKRKPSIAQRIQMCIDIANGLQYLHGVQTTHGDIKPANILIDDYGNARLCDFGLASLLGEEVGTGLTTTTEYVGTARYAAPEIFNRPNDAVGYVPTPASDMFSFGCVIYEITTCNVPYPMLKSSIRLGIQILARMMKEIPPALRSDDLDQHLSGYAPKIWSILDRCWNFDPASRPSAADVVMDLTVIHNSGESAL